MSADRERTRRERVILQLIQTRALGTQGELVEALQAEGLEVTQATVSRDIRRLGLTKVPAAGGGYRWGSPGRPAGSFVLGTRPADAFLVVQTLPGRAMAVASSIDEAQLPHVVATLAGDDVVVLFIEGQHHRAEVEAALQGRF